MGIDRYIVRGVWEDCEELVKAADWLSMFAWLVGASGKEAKIN